MVQLLLKNGAHWDIGHDVATTALEWAATFSGEMV
jgi:hypothetical protein